MDHRAARALIALATLTATSCHCGDEQFDLPETPPPEPPTTPEVAGDPRIPPGFDLPIPEGATVRYGEATRERAVVLATTDAAPEAVLREVRTALEARGLVVRDRAPGAQRPLGRFRRAIEARAGDAIAASAIVERGAAEITRVHLTQRVEGRRSFHAPEEPREWRAIDRGPLPALPGSSETRCNAAMTAACEAWAASGGPDAIDCALDHRNACGHLAEASGLSGYADDARERLAAALRAHARVGSRRARAWTLGQLRVELLAAKANLVRAAAGGAAAPALADLVAAVEAEGVRVDADTSAWFAADGDAPAEIPGGLVP